MTREYEVQDHKWANQRIQPSFTKEEVLRAIEEDKGNFRTEFVIESKKMIISMMQKGKSFRVSRYTENKGFSVSEGEYKIINDVDKFAEFVSNPSVEALNDFEEDGELRLKRFFSAMSQDTKDKVLYAMLKKQFLEQEEV